jgi:hypothetical protein
LKKITLAFILVFFLLIFSVNSLTTFFYNETDLVSLQPQATDPDAQKLIYTYSKPLNKEGEWQTTYGDAGEYVVTITVSDGELSTSQDVLIVVNKKEVPPNIDSFKPKEEDIYIDEGKTIKFSVKGSDLNKDELSYIWFLNDEEVAEGREFVFSPDYSEAGDYVVKVVLSDGMHDVSKEWNLVVNDVDLHSLLDSIKDVEVNETEAVRLELPDFKKYGLSYKISEPVGDDNYWLTDYNSQGEYLVTVDVQGKGFSGSKDVDVLVKNKDRPPEFEIQSLYFVKENEDLIIELNATDPDGEKISFSADNMPEGSSLNDGVFEWKPGYDVVKRESAFDNVLEKFHLLTKSFTVTFIAKTKEGEAKKDVKIVVKDNNRPFVIEDFEDIEVKEGDVVKIEPKYSDPDNDKVSFTYSGWMDRDIYRTTYGDAGEYYVKVTGTDGYHTDYKFVKIIVEKSNREPVFTPLGDFYVNENEILKIDLIATDPDNDEIEFSGVDLPSGSILEGNVFTWQPDFDFVSKEEGEKSIVVSFIASDGEAYVVQNSTITVYDKNRPPEIIEVSGDDIANVNEPFIMWVNAEDKDGDELTYEWVFGRFESYEATPVMERTFTSKGDKKVRVIVSDGLEFVEYEWDIKVV